MTATTRIAERDVVLVEDAHLRPMMGLEVLEPVPARNVPYELSDPFILVHEATVPIDGRAGEARHHPPAPRVRQPLVHPVGRGEHGPQHRPRRDVRACPARDRRPPEVRTGRGVYHAESIGADQLAEGRTGEFRSVLFWVNLARKDKGAEPTAQVVASGELPTRTEHGTIVRTLVGPGSPVELGTPGLIPT